MTYIEFKQIYQNFFKASRYMAEKRLSVQDVNDPKWQKLVETYFTKIVDPMEEAWRQLPKDVRAYFKPKKQLIRKEQNERSNLSNGSVPF